MHNYGFNPKIEEKYLKLLNASKELKRLQKEIDEQQNIEEKSVIDNWGKRNHSDYQNGYEAYKKKTELQSKIKQLIEEL